MAYLKPCPFCGGSVSIAKAGDNAMLWFFITRGNGENPCKCRLFMESEDFAIGEDAARVMALRKELIIAWNSRADARKGFTVIDNKTGSYPDVERIALEEEWAKHLCYCDIDSFAITEDGTLILTDDCGRSACCPDGRFTVVWEG